MIPFKKLRDSFNLLVPSGVGPAIQIRLKLILRQQLCLASSNLRVKHLLLSHGVISGLRSIVNMGSAVLIGISIVGYALSQTQASSPLVLDQVRSARTRRDSRQGNKFF